MDVSHTDGERPALSGEAAAALEDARRAVERYDGERAAAALDVVARSAPDWWELHHLRGILAARRRSWEEAEQLFQRAHRLNPRHPGPLTNLGNLRTEREDYEEAIRYYEQALALDPDYANAHHNLAVAYRRLGRLDDAVRHLKRAHRLQGMGGRAFSAGRPQPAGWLLLFGALLTLAVVWWSFSQGGAP